MGHSAYSSSEVAVNEHLATLDRETLELQNHTTERLQVLLSSFWSLRSNNRFLVDQLRGSIDQLRTLRRNLQQPPRSIGSEPNGKTERSSLREEFGLTKREEEVALLLSQGFSNQAIARELKISTHTARHHTQRILVKLEVHSRAAAGAKIRR
jgi:DNA-binding NarL/FixJ family response regulator